MADRRDPWIPAPDEAGVVDDPDRDLAHLLADERDAQAVRARRAEGALRQQATEDATGRDLLVDLAERGTPVTVRTTAGRAVHGVITGIGADFVCLGEATYVALRAVATVRATPGVRPAPTGRDGGDVSRLTLAQLVAAVAPERPSISAVVDGEAAPVTGELRAAGTDVWTVRTDGDPPATVYVLSGAVAEVTLLA